MSTLLSLLKVHLSRFRSDEPGDVVWRQRVYVFGGLAVVILIVLVTIGVLNRPSSDPKKTQKPGEKPHVLKFEGPASRAPREEIWARRMENEATKIKEEKKALEGKLEVMSKEVAVLKDLIEKSLSMDPYTDADMEKEGHVPGAPTAASHKMPRDDFDTSLPTIKADTFPLVSAEESAGHRIPQGTGERGGGYDPYQEGVKPEDFKHIAVLKRKHTQKDAQIIEGHIPGGSRVKGVMLSGLAVSTSTNSQSDPHPVIIRLRDDFNIPRGFTAPLKNAVVVGKCHGDRAAERAFCTLETISYVEPSGEFVEEKIEGWVFAEDGRYGVKGEVIDRADDLLRDSFLSGLASGMASFFQASTTSSVFPVSPFGQTNALKTPDMLKAGASNGVGQAMDRLSKYYIDTAEKMSPVLLINPGRRVDIVLRTKFDMRKSSYRNARVREANPTRQQFALDHARLLSRTVNVRKDLQ
ncbi:MAG: TrbI/VirB10 family protein [Alphaproteobacteria bacterium]|jgi:conjugal transfer pilus assembly protein TraB